jgi:hypothetical protein
MRVRSESMAGYVNRDLKRSSVHHVANDLGSPGLQALRVQANPKR